MANKKTSKSHSSGGKIKGRPKPTAPRAGYLASKRRYDEGGKVNR